MLFQFEIGNVLTNARGEKKNLKRKPVSVSMEEVVKTAFYGKDDTELEARIGTMHGNTFHAGIDAHTFDAINDLLCSYGGWATRSETSRHDFFLGDRRLTSSPDMAKPICIKKIKLAAFAEPILLKNPTSSDRPPAVRVSTAREIVCDADLNAAFTSATFVRVKETLSWQTSSGFSYELSRVWQGTSLSVAMKKRHEGDPRFEFEIELVDRSYLQTKGYAYVTRSLLLKMKDVMAAVEDRKGRRSID